MTNPDPGTSSAGVRIPHHIVPCTGDVTIGGNAVALDVSAVVLLSVGDLQTLQAELKATPGSSASVVVTLTQITTMLEGAGH